MILSHERYTKVDSRHDSIVLSQLGTVIDTFDDIRSLLELFRNSNQDLNNAKYAARHIYT